VRITDDLLDGEDISLSNKDNIVLTSKGASLEDILHVICVYTDNQAISSKKGVISVSGSQGIYDGDRSIYLNYTLYYDVASKNSSLMIIGDVSSKLKEFTNSLLKVRGMGLANAT